MNLLCLNSDELIQKLRDENAENLRLRLKAEEDKRKAEDDKKKAEDDKTKAEEDKRKAEEDKKKAQDDKRKAEEKHKAERMKTIEAICRESPWQH